MEKARIENNSVTITGEIVSDFEYSHEIFGESFYTMYIKINRITEGKYDTIPVTISERIINVNENLTGKFVTIIGQYRSYNLRQKGENMKLILSVFARNIEFLEDSSQVDAKLNNIVHMIGYVCKKPIYRETPLGKRITDLLIAVNRPYGKSDYIPCITWKENALYADTFEIGQKVEITGRIQSRKYMKRISESECVEKIAYEVSARKIFTCD